ncbi:hypothetical protein TorRG33x02_223150 [Trema orientale]|uniref:Uncharacterized protein n=1 Tax=Trema orientale TaxID=63057 RepID=A0A2P5E8Q2_TREOI|nr:hypothetical protein TorRG33x02_223150 [Trema orientale]
MAAPATSESEVTHLEGPVSSNDGATKTIIFQHKWSCPTDAAAYKTIVEKKQIHKFLLGLYENLDEVRCRILPTNSFPNIREFFQKFDVKKVEGSLCLVLLQV